MDIIQKCVSYERDRGTTDVAVSSTLKACISLSHVTNFINKSLVRKTVTLAQVVYDYTFYTHTHIEARGISKVKNKTFQVYCRVFCTCRDFKISGKSQQLCGKAAKLYLVVYPPVSQNIYLYENILKTTNRLSPPNHKLTYKGSRPCALKNSWSTLTLSPMSSSIESLEEIS